MGYLKFPYGHVEYYLEARKIDLTSYCYGYHEYACFTDGKDHYITYKDPIFIEMEKEYGLVMPLPPKDFFSTS